MTGKGRTFPDIIDRGESMQTRFLKLLLGLILIYIVGIIGMFNFQSLFQSQTCGEVTIRFEQKKNIPLQDVQQWMGTLSRVQCNKINVYRQENFIEVVLPYEDNVPLEPLLLNKSIARMGMPLQIMHSEIKPASVFDGQKWLLLGVLWIFLATGVYLIYLSIRPSNLQHQLKN